MKCAILRERAEADINAAFDHYLSVAPAKIATNFVLEVDACMRRVEQFPAAGSPRYAELLDLDGLRSVVVERFPYIVFYVERDDCVDVIRVLHQHQDLPAVLQE